MNINLKNKICLSKQIQTANYIGFDQSEFARKCFGNQRRVEKTREPLESDTLGNECWFCIKEARRAAMGSSADHNTIKGSFYIHCSNDGVTIQFSEY